MNKNAVYLTDQEARLLPQFMRHYELFKRLDELDALRISDGKIEILIDTYGKVGDVFIHTRHKRVALD